MKQFDRFGVKARQGLMELIDSKVLIKRLHENAEAKEEFMTSGQIQCAVILLKRTFPEVRIVDQTTEHTFNGDFATVSTADIKSIIAGRLSETSGRKGRGKARPSKVRQVH
jgi:hypothetical protein